MQAGNRRELRVAQKSIWTRIGDALAPGASEDIEKRTAVPTKAIGTSNINGNGGYIFENERDPNLVGANRWKTYDEMLRNTTIVATGVRAFLNLLSGAQWTVNAAEGQEENPKAQEIADLCYDCLFDMTTSWATVVRKTAMFRFNGSAILEWTAKRRADGAIGFMDIENRPVSSIEKWNRDASGTLESVTQRTLVGGVAEIPRSKVVYAVDDTLTDSPEGLGLFRHCAPTDERLKIFLGLEETGFTTDLRGIPIARAPLEQLRREVEAAGGGEASKKAEANRINSLEPLRKFVRRHLRSKDTGVMLSSDTFMSQGGDTQSPSSVYKWDLDLLNGDSTSFADIAKSISRMTQELARLLGVEHLLLGSDGTGSLALAQSKIGTFYLNLSSTLQDLVEIFERDIIGPLALLNGWPDELLPELAVAEISEVDIEMVTRALASLATAGAPLTPDDPAVGEVRDRLGLSRTPSDLMAREADAAISPGPGSGPEAPLATNPEDQVAKQRLIKSQRGRAREARAMLRKAE